MREVLVAGAVLTLALTACGGDDGGGKVTPSTSGSAGGAPVALTGTVNDHGTKELGDDTKADMELDDFYFGPTYVHAKPSTTVTLELENEGKAPHTFTIDGGPDVTVQPGQKGEAKVTLPASGAVRFYCKFHASQGMQGAFYFQAGDTVAPAGAPSGSSDGGAYNQ